MSATERFLEGKPWASAAKCGKLQEKELDRLFYPDVEGNALHTINQAAKELCAACPVKVECLDAAIEAKDIFLGVRGGLLPYELQKERAARRKARGDRSISGRRTPKNISRGQY